jgi:small neutral amino acid transporter SnatA (MarC family)
VTLALLVLAAVSAVNPARARSALPRLETVVVGALGAAVTWVVLVPVVVLADVVLDAAQVAASTLRMAGGLVLVMQGGWAVLTGPPRAEPALPGRRAALVPVAFPVLLTPGLGLLAVSGALDRSGPAALVVLAAALATVPAVACVDASAVRLRALDGLGRVTAAVLVVSGVALVLDGVFDI